NGQRCWISPVRLPDQYHVRLAATKVRESLNPSDNFSCIRWCEELLRSRREIGVLVGIDVLRWCFPDDQFRFGISVPTDDCRADSTHLMVHGHRLQRADRLSFGHGLLVVTFGPDDNLRTNLGQPVDGAINE